MITRAIVKEIIRGEDGYPTKFRVRIPIFDNTETAKEYIEISDKGPNNQVIYSSKYSPENFEEAKAKVEYLNSLNKAVPLTTENKLYVTTYRLSDAIACLDLNTSNLIKVGDVVFVGFEDNDISRPVLLGPMYNQFLAKSPTTDVKVRSIQTEDLTVTNSVTLPVGTTIGEISYSELQKLKTFVNTGGGS